MPVSLKRNAYFSADVTVVFILPEMTYSFKVGSGRSQERITAHGETGSTEKLPTDGCPFASKFGFILFKIKTKLTDNATDK